MSKLVGLRARIPEEMRKFFKDEAHRRNVSFNRVINEILEKYIEMQKKQLQKKGTMVP